MDLDWQNSLTEIKDRGQYLLHSEKWADCHFLVGTPPNQRLIAGHKLLLAMASPVFERMFFGNLPDKTDPIIIPDVQAEAFEAMLEYIYTDRISIGSFDKACELCYVAKKYMLPHVVTRCTHFVWADLSPKNACRAYEFAKLFDESTLMKSSMDLIAANTREVLNDPSFLDIEVSTLMAILDQNRLYIDSELDLFNCLVKFASERGILNESSQDSVPSGSGSQKAQSCAERAEHSASVDSVAANVVVEEIKMEPDVIAMVLHMQQDEELEMAPNGSAGNSPVPDAVSAAAAAVASPSPTHASDDVVIIDSDASGHAHEPMNATDAASNMLNIMDVQRSIMDTAMLRQAVKKIRFLTMTPQQFAEGPARSKLLQQHEALAILIKISSPTLNDCDMPEGFCSSRSSRNFYESSHHQHKLNSSYRNNNIESSSTAWASGAPTRTTNQPLFTRQRTSAPLNLNMDNMPAIAALMSHEQLGFQANGVAAAAAGAAAAAAAAATGFADGFECAAPVAPAAPALGQIVPTGRDSDNSHHDMIRSYCMRSISRQFDYRNMSVTDCGVTFQVDTNIWILGVQVPTQVLCGELMNSAGFAEHYTEVLYAHIQDMHGSRIAYTHCTARVRYDSHLDITFDRPVYIYRNQIYKVFVVFNKTGWYPMYSCVPDSIRQRVKFMFNVGNPMESVRDGLIYAIIFSTPQDHARQLVD
ncbi:CG17068 [Drosophila busckii]|uniref:CG17068 n=1 Tax=Drosophila busckii TaxID=30019 RepID=A0A0M4EZ51_DROBS|nr:uncharacterized protein LOC108605532 [Drosophila busckii]ALC49380.1 CG17068 [Drosophila busckii]